MFASLLAVTGQSGTGLQAGTNTSQVTVGCQQAAVGVRPIYREDFSASSGFDVPLTGFEISGVQQSCVTEDSAWVLAVELGGSFQELPEVLVLQDATPVATGVYRVGPGPITAVASMGITGYSIRIATAETPGAPTVSVEPGDQSAVVTYSAPALQGFSAVSAYEYSLNGGAWAAVGSASPWTLGGLTNGTTYEIQLRAVNAVGPGAATAAVSVTPRTTPDAPAEVTVSSGDGQLSVAFTAGSDGGTPITNYQYSLNGGTTWTTRAPASTASPLTITGLTNGTYYTVAVRAVNAVGAGVASASTMITPSVAVIATAWGANFSGRLGDGSTVQRATPVAVTASGALAGKTVARVAAGYHTCALDTAGKAYCWGPGSAGVLGNNSSANSSVPVAVDISGVLAGKTLTEITTGSSHSCALDTAGKAYCWGWGISGRLGNNSTATSRVPVEVDTSGVLAGKTLTQIGASGSTTCALDTAGKGYCWGYNADGQLGNNSTADSSVPVAVSTELTFAQISAGWSNTCALTSAGKAYCWGSNLQGRLGINNTSDSNWLTPTPVYASGVLNGKTLTQISSGSVHTCALDTAGKAYCWGYQGVDEAALGNNSTTLSRVPVAVNTTAGAITSSTVLRQISVSGLHSCAVDTAGKAYCWGRNVNGQLGSNSTSGSSVPVAVYGNSTFTQLDAGDDHNVGLETTPVVAWGGNANGQLGDGSTTNRSSLVAVTAAGVLAGKTLSQVDTGGEHSCVLDATGKAYCWGDNAYGQLGNNSTTDSAVPVAVNTSGVLAGKTVRQISAGDGHTCAVDTARLAYCWGLGTSGQLGNNSISSSSVPVTVYGNRSFTWLEAGKRHTLGF